MIEPYVSFSIISDVEIDKRADTIEYNNVDCTIDINIAYNIRDIASEVFSIEVLTIYALEKMLLKDKFYMANNSLIVDNFVKKDVLNLISEYVEECSGPTYESVIIKLMQYFRYEHEDEFVENLGANLLAQ